MHLLHLHISICWERLNALLVFKTMIFCRNAATALCIPWTQQNLAVELVTCERTQTGMRVVEDSSLRPKPATSVVTAITQGSLPGILAAVDLEGSLLV